MEKKALVLLIALLMILNLFAFPAVASATHLTTQAELEDAILGAEVKSL